jgi:acetate CoA/acetoacetate CoA-transferase alpha subunit
MAQVQRITVADVVAHIKSGDRIMVGGFGGTGSPHAILEGIVQSKLDSLTIICNDGGFPDRGVGRLISARKVRHLIASHVGNHPLVTEQVRDGTLQLELLPQGLFAEKIRAAAAGLRGIVVDQGWASEHANYVSACDGYYEPAIHADHALIAAWQGDRYGNLRYHQTACNHNPAMAMAATHAWAEVAFWQDKIAIEPELVHTPGVWIHGIVTTGE